MMKRFTAIALLALILSPLTYAQKYEMSFVIPQEGVHDSMLYIGQHYRDQFRVMDSARLDKKGTYTKLIGASMHSVFAHTEEWVTVHILTMASMSSSRKSWTIPSTSS